MTNEPVIHYKNIFQATQTQNKFEESNNILNSSSIQNKSHNAVERLESKFQQKIIKNTEKVEVIEEELIINPSVKDYLNTLNIKLLPEGGRIKRLGIIFLTFFFFYLAASIKYIVSRKKSIYSFCSIRKDWHVYLMELYIWYFIKIVLITETTQKHSYLMKLITLTHLILVHHL